MIDDVSSEELLNACIEHIGNKGQKEKIENLKDEILHAIDEYKMKATSGELCAMPHMALDDDVKNTLISLYKNQMGKAGNKNLPRKTYERILKNVNYECPYCSVGFLYTIDHFLPKNKNAFPEFAVTIENLVPACSDCNRIKGEYISTDTNKQFLHPFFDGEIKEKWLMADFRISNDMPIFVYNVIDTDAIDPVLLQRIKFQFELLNLAWIYECKAISKFNEMSDKWKLNPDKNSLCEAIGHIYNQSNVNTWETCFGEALINKVDILSRYLKQKMLSDI